MPGIDVPCALCVYNFETGGGPVRLHPREEHELHFQPARQISPHPSPGEVGREAPPDMRPLAALPIVAPERPIEPQNQRLPVPRMGLTTLKCSFLV